MSYRLKSFADLSGTPPNPKSVLDALAAAASVAPFPAVPPGGTYASATAWDRTKSDYAIDAIVYGPSGDYYRCVSTPPAGTPLSHATYWTPATPVWVSHMNTVREAVATRLWDAVRAAGCSDGEALAESAVLSGPWPLSASWWQDISTITGATVLDGGTGLAITSPFSADDGAGHTAGVQPYSMLGLELLTGQAGARLDIATALASNSWASVVSGPDNSWDFRLKLDFSRPAYVRGIITCGVVRTTAWSDPGAAELTTNGVFDAETSTIRWELDGTMSGIYASAHIVPRAHPELDPPQPEIWELQLGHPLDTAFATWAGQEQAVAANVLSTSDVYRSLAPDPVPRVTATVYAAGTGGTIESSVYGGGANVAPMYAVVAGMPAEGSWPPWRMRGRTYPAASVAYATLPIWTTDPFWQRQPYVCQPVGDIRVITPTAGQVAVIELDMLWGKRDLVVVDQLRPIMDRVATSVDRGTVAAAVGYLRPGESGAGSMRTFIGAGLSVGPYQMEHVRDLGRSGALIVWDNSVETPLPLRWDGAGLIVAAAGPVGAWAPNGSQGWSWTGYGGAVGVGYFCDVAAHVDDLLAVLALL